jgi:hypothetical protein
MEEGRKGEKTSSNMEVQKNERGSPKSKGTGVILTLAPRRCVPMVVTRARACPSCSLSERLTKQFWGLRHVHVRPHRAIRISQIPLTSGEQTCGSAFSFTCRAISLTRGLLPDEWRSQLDRRWCASNEA